MVDAGPCWVHPFCSMSLRVGLRRCIFLYWTTAGPQPACHWTGCISQHIRWTGAIAGAAADRRRCRVKWDHMDSSWVLHNGNTTRPPPTLPLPHAPTAHTTTTAMTTPTTETTRRSAAHAFALPHVHFHDRRNAHCMCTGVACSCAALPSTTRLSNLPSWSPSARGSRPCTAGWTASPRTETDACLSSMRQLMHAL